ncbi:ATP-binding protein [Candidatus Pacearchaeota archaeon]|nr:ATP-binding protein [Candidatus Pacearchaeota archaeon]
MPYDIVIGRDPADKEKFGDKGLIYLGKGYVKMGNYTSLSNKIWMDIARSHIILIAGKRGSGKSYSIGVIAEELSNLPQETAKNIAPLIFDTMGIFWTMKYENEKDSGLLKTWDLKTMNLPVKIFVPFGKINEYKDKNIPFDETLAIEASELGAEDWLSLFNLEIISPVGVLLERVISSLKDIDNQFSILDVIKKIESDPITNSDTKDSAVALFTAAESWGIFAKEKGTKITDLINAGTTTVLDISAYSSISIFNVRALIISLIIRKLFISRLDARKKEELESISHGKEYLSFKSTRDQPLIWIFLDEAHEFLQREGKTPATDALVQILREGRQPGISLVLATQQPGQIHKDVMTQSDIVIAHKLTAKTDLDALNEIMQSYIPESIKKQMDSLPSLKGSAIILDDNSERIYPVKIRPRFTWHGGEAPTAVKSERGI